MDSKEVIFQLMSVVDRYSGSPIGWSSGANVKFKMMVNMSEVLPFEERTLSPLIHQVF